MSVRIIAGLGNPDDKYKETYHNVGFSVMDKIAEKLNFVYKKNQYHALCHTEFMGLDKVLFLKPLTYMNLSGESIREAMGSVKASPAELLIIYDDFDLKPGELRMRGFGSAGTHNGMRSIIDCIGTDRFPRLRVGIGRSEIPQMSIVDFVLSKIKGPSAQLILSATDRAADACIKFAKGESLDRIMQEYNG